MSCESQAGAIFLLFHFMRIEIQLEELRKIGKIEEK